MLRGHRSLLSSDQTHLPLHQMTLPQHRMAQGFQPVYTEIVGTINTPKFSRLCKNKRMNVLILTFSLIFALSPFASSLSLLYFSVLSFSIRLASAAFSLSYNNHIATTEQAFKFSTRLIKFIKKLLIKAYRSGKSCKQHLQTFCPKSCYFEDILGQISRTFD